MRAWSSAVFPLSVLGVLAAISFWLVQVTASPEPRSDGKDRHDPDYIISQMEIRKLTKDGDLQYVLLGDEARHYPDDDSTDVARPRLTYLQPSKPTLYMNADSAQISKDGETVFLHGDVRIKRDPTPKRAALFAYSPDLTVRTEEEIAFTKSPVRFTQGASRLAGVGMHVDNKKQLYVLQSQAKGQFESRKAKRK